MATRTHTRTRILEAAREVVENEGATAGMGRIADRAGVSRRAVYLHFESRGDLLLSLVEHVDETGNLSDRATRVTEAADGLTALDEFVSLNAEYNPEIHLIARALERARDTDEAAASAWEDRMAGRRALCRWISRRVSSEGLLREGVSIGTAADLIWSLTNIPLWRDLVEASGWSPRRYEQWVRHLLHSLVIGPVPD